MSVKVTKGSANVFRDLGFSPVEAEHLRVRAEPMLTLEKLIARRKLTPRPRRPSCSGSVSRG